MKEIMEDAEMNREQIEKVAEMVVEKINEKVMVKKTIVRTVDKADGKRTGIYVLNDDGDICCNPVFYIDKDASMISKKLETVEDVVKKIVHFFRKKYFEFEEDEPDRYDNIYNMARNFDSIKDFLTLRIVNADEKYYEKDVPYFPYNDDLAIYIGIDMPFFHEAAFIMVTKKLLEIWKKEATEIKAIAEINDKEWEKSLQKLKLYRNE